MKVTIAVTRTTQYSSIVDMSQADFNQLNAALDGDDKIKRIQAEAQLNDMIDVDDWQDDELRSVDEFCEFNEDQS